MNYPAIERDLIVHNIEYVLLVMFLVVSYGNMDRSIDSFQHASGPT